MNRICLKRRDTGSRKSNFCTLAENPPNENQDLDKQQKVSEIHNSIMTIQLTKNQLAEGLPEQKLQQISNSSSTAQTLKPNANSQPSVPNQNQRLFEQFKIQYDQLRAAYETQRALFDQISQQKKKLQIQILNSNPQFYEKQIRRLKSQLEKSQQENQDNKHKYIMSENIKRQLQATVKVRNEELKKTIQLLEKEKVGNVELKHQIGEKQKFYQRITLEMQKSNGVISQSFEEANQRIQKLENALKLKTQEHDNLQRVHEKLNKNFSENEKLFKATKDNFEQINSKKAQIIEELQSKVRNLNRTSRDTIEGLENQLSQFRTQRKTENLLIEQTIQSKVTEKQQRICQLDIIRLEESNKQIKLDLENKQKLIKSLEESLKKTYSQEEYQELETKYKELDETYKNLEKTSNEKLAKLEKQLQQVKLQQYKNPANEKGVNGDFQQLLRLQIEENSKLKRELSFKIDEVYNLKADVDEQKCKLRISQDEISILNKKLKSQQKNHKIEADVGSQNLKSEIDSLKRKLDMAQFKIDQKVKQIKEKQSFILKSIVGRSRQEDGPLIMAQVQKIFEADYITKLNAANQKIGDLQKLLYPCK